MNLSHSFGFWREFYSKNYQRASIFDDIKDVHVSKDKDKILSFLKEGFFIGASRQTMYCPIHKDAIGTQEVFTDGEWFWTIEAIHYVEKYDIAIPIAFIQHMKNHGFICPKLNELDYDIIDPLCDFAQKIM
jgi:hypothetical protein